ncbi:hypothetical protein FIU87_12340 [Bacillus sp. THAF10]|uniref:helix-turn-helix domain-containing protein n=1 Tax=Bacillus sp. THAF10 TaxID=2587848 RepID=UPI0012AA67A7|nr:helix-turn-helix domain-containing protein [Bacillus sp. THAF10]QFT89439.1 hypothetical protein FIU87_12340 [Bacillus sp. THAF10]
MKSFEYLCLFCIQSFRGERSISAIYHLFRGKKSSQTIQDTNIFSLQLLYGVFPEMQREFLENTIYNLEHAEMIKEVEVGHYRLTHIGKLTLTENASRFPLDPYLNGYRYKDSSAKFWERYALLIQTLSNLEGNEKSFIPITYDEPVQSWVKGFLLQYRGKTKKQLLDVLYEETSTILEQVPTLQSEVLVLQLSGYQRAGLTLSQLAKLLQKDPVWIQIQFLSVLHYFVQILEQKEAITSFPILFSICRDLLSRPHLTETTQKTLHYLKMGFSLFEIAQARSLKISTIEDHIVELAMQKKGFSILPYVSDEEIAEIKTVIDKCQTHQLRKIKSELQNETISYFQIRLVLTRMEDNNGSRKTVTS